MFPKNFVKKEEYIMICISTKQVGNLKDIKVSLNISESQC